MFLEALVSLNIFVTAENTEKVEYWIVPTGTYSFIYAKKLGENIDGSDGWSFTFNYGEETLHDHIKIIAIGAGGSVATSFIIETIGD